MNRLEALHRLARRMGVYVNYVDGLHRPVEVEPETLVRVCASLGAPVSGPDDAAEALLAWQADTERIIPPVLVAWDGVLSGTRLERDALADLGALHGQLWLETGETVRLGTRVADDGGVELEADRLSFGYHRLTLETADRSEDCTVISAPLRTWRRPGEQGSWGFAAHLAALRSARSRSVGDLRDLEATCRWVAGHGGDVLMVLPLLPTFNRRPEEPSPYSPVSRLFWSELILDLESGHETTGAPARLDVARGDEEVRRALAGAGPPDPSTVDEELARYARFRGAQAVHGRNWRDWPVLARRGETGAADVDPEEERFHLVAQSMVRRQLGDLRQRLGEFDFRLALDLAVGVHPDGYDTWSRQGLFAEGMSVGAPPDGGFPSGQDWGFPPVHPGASRLEGHRYLAASIAHQTELAGVLRIDHVMAWTRLYWIPHGMGKHQGTYVSYPADELFAVLALESHRNECEIAGENLGTVPPEIDAALPRHGIWGMYLAQFAAMGAGEVDSPSDSEMAMVGTHDTPPFQGWIDGQDIGERVHYGLLAPEEEPEVRREREVAVDRLAARVDANAGEPGEYLAALLEWLGRSDSPLLVPWIEDLWLEPVGVNLPGTMSSVRPNWQRPMRLLLDTVFEDREIAELVRRLARARHSGRSPEAHP
jgi:4-alpha-glucanotransferase